MKYCIVIPDGAADRAVPRLADATPLEAARTPNMDRAAADGLLGMVSHVPARMTPGSSVAMMSVVGYDPREHYTGRGPLEAADLGIPMAAGDWALRCNLITAVDDTLEDFTAGHVTTEEAGLLLSALNAELGSAQIEFHVGTAYRHIMTWRCGRAIDAQAMLPHEMVGGSLRANYPEGGSGKWLADLMERSRAVLEGHEVNQVRADLGKNPANMIWLWGQGMQPELPAFEGRFGVRGGVISGVNLVRGIGRLIGWDVIDVPGATAYTDTDYAAKGRYAVDALGRLDLVLVHVEAPDEASHEGDVAAKVRAIERIDREIVGPVMAHREMVDGLRLLVMPDHVTAVGDGRHKRGAVPYLMWGDGVKAASGRRYMEAHARATDVELEHGHDLMAEFLGRGY